MPLLPLTDLSYTRPNRLEDIKNKEYHLKMARYGLTGYHHPKHSDFMKRCLINEYFYEGKQWIMEEDLVNFLMDESGEYRHRIRIVKNIILPAVQHFLGNAARMAFDANVESFSEFVVNDREERLAELMYYQLMAEKLPFFGKYIREVMPIGEDEEETLLIHENLFKDRFREKANALLAYLKDRVDLEDIKMVATRHLALRGMCIYKDYEQNNEYMGEPIDPMYFFWDKGARRQDLQDASFMGEYYYMDSPATIERFQPEASDRKRIEKMAADNSSNIARFVRTMYGIPLSHLGIYEVYWRDLVKEEYGYVIDEYNQPYFTRINHEDSDYTSKDLIPPPTEKARKRLGNKKSANVYAEQIRYCVFIPRSEAMSEGEDIVLEYGELPYSETNPLEPIQAPYPYKVYCWSYDKGNVMTPIDSMIDFQRLTNRVISAAESIINQSGGRGVVLHRGAILDEDEGDVKIAIKKGEPLTIDASAVGGVQNAVGNYDTSISQGIKTYFDIVTALGLSNQDQTGINEAMTGTEGNLKQLVGVLESRIERGTLMQEPFFYALTKMLTDACRSMVDRGRRIYLDNPRKLVVSAGEEGLKILELTEKDAVTNFRLSVKRTLSRDSIINQVNGLIMQMLQLGLLDDIRAANLFNRADITQLAEAIRDFAHEKILMRRKEQQQQQEQEAAMARQLEEQAAAVEEDEALSRLREDKQRIEEQMHDLNKIGYRAMAKRAQGTSPGGLPGTGGG